MFVAGDADDHGGASMYGVGQGPAREGGQRPLGVLSVLYARGWLRTVRLVHARVLCRAILEQGHT